MARSRLKMKGRRESGSFIAVPHDILNHPNYHALSHRAARMFFDLYGQYYGNNNGDFTASLSVMKNKGWNSNDQISKALNELLDRGWIIITRRGSFPRLCNLYGVTFKPINECQGKLDIKPTTAPLNTWRDNPTTP